MAVSPDAELVALEVRHDNPVLALVALGPERSGPEPPEAAPFGVPRARRSGKGTFPPPLVFTSKWTRFFAGFGVSIFWK